MFQALVAAAAARDRFGMREHAGPALTWLEQRSAPDVMAPVAMTSTGYRISVPNNAMDVVAKAWCRGNDSNSGDANPAKHRTMKTVRPSLLVDGGDVHYLWTLPDPLTDDVRGHLERLTEIARSVVALGWGVDMVVAQCAVIDDERALALSGERWLPVAQGAGQGLRVPVPGTLDALVDRHARFLARLGPDGFTAPPPLTCYATVGYRRATDPAARAVAAFSLLKLDASGFRAFDTARRALTVAGMMRHATRRAATDAGWSEATINAFVLGHGEPKDGTAHVAVGPQRFAYLPLPSIEARGEGKGRVVGAVRRVLLTTFAEGCDAEVAWARRSLSGQEVVDEHSGKPAARLSLVPASDRVVQNYTQASSSWATVTPVVLPGYDDARHYRRRLARGVPAEGQKQLLRHMDDRVDGLLRKAIVHAGLPRILADHAELEWREVGFCPGVGLPSSYGVPDHLRRFPRFHVRLGWRDAAGNSVAVPGPICLGGGRFAGLGLFAAWPEA
jgi:CRISPR-associated protein Csb2